MRQNQMWRWSQAGDLNGDGEKINVKMLRELTQANNKRKVIAYTHYSPIAVKDKVNAQTAKHNRAAIKEATKNGFVINLSGNNPTHADKLFALKIAPVVSVVPTSQTKNFLTNAGNRVVICPASVRDNVTCANCGICTRANREYIVGFPAHGTAHKTVSEMAKLTN